MSDKRPRETAGNDENYVKTEVEQLKEIANEYKVEDIKSGKWFENFLFYALRSYIKNINWKFFQDKYPYLPVDAIVARRIALAQRYAMIEGGITASVYSLSLIHI